MDKIIEFLLEAKRNTYAGKGKEEAPSRLNSHDLKYEKGEFMYYDTYLGGDLFSGEEALWINKNPYWSMNYIGRVIGDNFSGDFLKEALKLCDESYPYRGPLKYTNGDYTYIMEVKGDFNWFVGSEHITYKNNLIYECNFHGGLIKNKR